MGLPWRTLLWAWLVALVLGLTAFIYAYGPTDVADALRLLRVYADRGGPRVWLLGIGAVLLLGVVVFGYVTAALDARGRARAPLPELPPGLPPNAQLIRESMAALGVRLSARLAGNADIPAFVDELIGAAFRFRASDIHITPREEGTRLALRVHGVLEDLDPVPSSRHSQIVSRIKVVARLTTYQHDRPQDGHFAWQTKEGATDVRVSILPTAHGEKVVLRLPLSGVVAPDIEALGIPAPVLARLLEVLARPQGVLFFTGPTGAGKTTTIYGALHHIKQSRGETTQIVTIEDPIELDLPFLGQTQVNPQVGLTFAQGLRSMLRQDPNVIMVGEIRDIETASIAIRAGMTGHLVLTTLHSESAAGVFARLIDMNVEPFLVASASLACMSQRLVRALCPYCREPATPSVEEARRLQQLGARGKWYAPRGCPRCRGTGYLGRTAVFELLVVDQTIRELIHARTPTPQIHEAAAKSGLPMLVDTAIDMAHAGTISLAEALRMSVWR